MLYERRLMYGETLGNHSTNDPFDYSDAPAIPASERIAPPEDLGYEEVVVVPVIASPYVEIRSNEGWEDKTAEILFGDIPDDVVPSAFDRTQMDYNGRDNRATPVIGFDDVSSVDYN